MKRHRPAQQRGVVMVMGLIMLVLLTIMGVVAFHMTTTQTTIVANAQHRNEATVAAQQVIDTVLSSSNFMNSPTAAIPVSNCASGGSNSLCIDVNGDGVPDVTVTLQPKPQCVYAAPISESSLNLSNASDLACAVQSQQSMGVAGTSGSGNSLCAQSLWEVTAAATDAATNTSVTLVQGVSSRIAMTDVTNNCP